MLRLARREGICRGGELLFSSGKYEEGALAVQFIKEYRDELDHAAVAGIGLWFAAGLRNWAHTDVLCGEILSPLLTDGAHRDRDYRAVAGFGTPVSAAGSSGDDAGADPKGRRCAAAVEVCGTAGPGASGAPGARMVCEAWKKQPAPVEAFLLKWKDGAARLIFQYATEKMTREQRNNDRRGGSSARKAAGR